MYRFMRLFFCYFLVFGWIHTATAGDGGLPSSFGKSNKCSGAFKPHIDVYAFEQIKKLQKTMNTLLDENGNFKPGVLKAALEKEPRGTTKYQVFYKEWLKFYNTKIEVEKLIQKIKYFNPEYRAISNEDYIMLTLGRWILSVYPNLSLSFYYQFDVKILWTNERVLDVKALWTSERVRFLRKTMNTLLDEEGSFKSGVLKAVLEKEPEGTTEYQIFDQQLRAVYSSISSVHKNILDKGNVTKLKSQENYEPSYHGVSNDNYILLILSSKILSVHPILLKKFYYPQIVESQQ